MANGPFSGVNAIKSREELFKKIKHRNYIRKNGMDLPEIRNWKWKE
jgi:phosphoketolase